MENFELEFRKLFSKKTIFLNIQKCHQKLNTVKHSKIGLKVQKKWLFV